MKKLIDKYFHGETSLEEERKLRDFLVSNDLDDEWQTEQMLFDAFQEEKNEKAKMDDLPIISQKILDISKKRKKNIRRWIALATGIAASFLLVITLAIGMQPKQEGYVIVNGKRINDPKLAARYIEQYNADVEALMKMAEKEMKIMEEAKRQSQLIEEEFERIKAEINHL